MDKLGNVLIAVMEDLSRLSVNDSARVQINSNIADPERFQSLFYRFSRGTLMERIDLSVDPKQPRINCSCGCTEPVDGQNPGYIKCPECGRFAEVDNRPYRLVEPEPEAAGARKSIRF